MNLIRKPTYSTSSTPIKDSDHEIQSFNSHEKCVFSYSAHKYYHENSCSKKNSKVFSQMNVSKHNKEFEDPFCICDSKRKHPNNCEFSQSNSFVFEVSSRRPAVLENRPLHSMRRPDDISRGKVYPSTTTMQNMHLDHLSTLQQHFDLTRGFPTNDTSTHSLTTFDGDANHYEPHTLLHHLEKPLHMSPSLISSEAQKNQIIKRGIKYLAEQGSGGVFLTNDDCHDDVFFLLKRNNHDVQYDEGVDGDDHDEDFVNRRTPTDSKYFPLDSNHPQLLIPPSAKSRNSTENVAHNHTIESDSSSNDSFTSNVPIHKQSCLSPRMDDQPVNASSSSCFLFPSSYNTPTSVADSSIAMSSKNVLSQLEPNKESSSNLNVISPPSSSFSAYSFFSSVKALLSPSSSLIKKSLIDDCISPDNKIKSVDVCCVPVSVPIAVLSRPPVTQKVPCSSPIRRGGMADRNDFSSNAVALPSGVFQHIHRDKYPELQNIQSNSFLQSEEDQRDANEEKLLVAFLKDRKVPRTSPKYPTLTVHTPTPPTTGFPIDHSDPALSPVCSNNNYFTPARYNQTSESYQQISSAAGSFSNSHPSEIPLFSHPSLNVNATGSMQPPSPRLPHPVNTLYSSPRSSLTLNKQANDTSPQRRFSQSGNVGRILNPLSLQGSTTSMSLQSGATSAVVVSSSQIGQVSGTGQKRRAGSVSIMPNEVIIDPRSNAGSHQPPNYQNANRRSSTASSGTGVIPHKGILKRPSVSSPVSDPSLLNASQQNLNKVPGKGQILISMIVNKGDPPSVFIDDEPPKNKTKSRRK
eukprot:GDKJ01018716.1.p1 GENE.GDKJ01018716.1~~GDKJ01018716.1.p1  ORF type:complete len:816 (-),score=164.39 GDKJ01018716.1:602-3007(-)